MVMGIGGLLVLALSSGCERKPKIVRREDPAAATKVFMDFELPRFHVDNREEEWTISSPPEVVLPYDKDLKFQVEIEYADPKPKDWTAKWISIFLGKGLTSFGEGSTTDLEMGEDGVWRGEVEFKALTKGRLEFGVRVYNDQLEKLVISKPTMVTVR